MNELNSLTPYGLGLLFILYGITEWQRRQRAKTRAIEVQSMIQQGAAESETKMQNVMATMLQSFNTQLEASAGREREYIAKNASLATRVDASERELERTKDQQSESQKLAATLTGKLESQTTQLDTLSRTKSEVQEKLDIAVGAKDAAWNALQTANQIIQDNGQTIADLRSEVARLAQRVTDLESESKTHHAQSNEWAVNEGKRTVEIARIRYVLKTAAKFWTDEQRVQIEADLQSKNIHIDELLTGDIRPIDPLAAPGLLVQPTSETAVTP